MTAIEELALYLDVPLDVEVEVQRHVLKVRDLLELERGTIIPLTRSAGENLDVRIGGALFGFGEIVVNEVTTGIRITDFKHED